MKPLEYLNEVKKNLQKKFRDCGERIKDLEARLDDEVSTYEELDKLLTEYEQFIAKNEVTDANSGGDSGVLVESVTEDLRLPGTESSVPL